MFVTEWGYINSNQTGVPYTTSPTWGTSFETVVDGNGASWTAWVTDNAWTPNMFTDTALTQLTDFGTLTKDWLARRRPPIGCSDGAVTHLAPIFHRLNSF